VNPFRYERPTDVGAAVALLQRSDNATILGGGTNLVDLMRLRVTLPEVLVDVTHLPYNRIEEVADGSLRIGGTVRNADLAAHPTVRQRYPVLAQALLAGASGQIRNVATAAGNLLQRTRCVYFQDVAKPCNKRRPGSGCPAREGYHRNLGILGTSDSCIATHPSDMAVALLALGASVRVTGSAGERTVALSDLYRLPGDHPERETTLERGEIITHVEIPAPMQAAGSRYRKVRDRASFAFALVSVAAVVAVDGGIVREARLALGGVAPMPWRAQRAEAALVEKPATEATFRAAADAELAQAQPLRDSAFKIPLSQRAIVRTLLDALNLS
jgi:xanthine dehydrogenase YagS FAD-binding subunit